ncbi:MAG: hypothetical protein IKL65_01295 [Bacilli bacterium]|nr:hypothetical protein [Bacilli bacterium]
MSSINFIEISIENTNQVIYIKINVKDNLIDINNKQRNISNEKIEGLLRIIRTWESVYEGEIIDNEKFMIRITGEDYVDKIKGNGSYPSNYRMFKDWIGEVYE